MSPTQTSGCSHFHSLATCSPPHISYPGGHLSLFLPSREAPRINTMRFHSLIAILAAPASRVVAEPLPPWRAPPPQRNFTLSSNAHSKSIEKSPLLLASVKNKPELESRGGQVSASFWLEGIKHQGISAFHPDKNSYQVFRNVKDFGAKGTCHQI